MPIVKAATQEQYSRQSRIDDVRATTAAANALVAEQAAFDAAEKARVADEFSKWAVTQGKTTQDYLSQYENDPNYDVIRDSSGTVTKIQQKEKDYIRSKWGDNKDIVKYSPHVIEFSGGKPLKEVYYDQYTQDKGDDYFEKRVAPRKVFEYKNGIPIQETFYRIESGETPKVLKVTNYDPTTGIPTTRQDSIFYRGDVMRVNNIIFGEGGSSSFTTQEFNVDESKKGSIADSAFILKNSTTTTNPKTGAVTVTLSDKAKSLGYKPSDYNNALNRLIQLTGQGGETGKLAGKTLLSSTSKSNISDPNLYQAVNQLANYGYTTGKVIPRLGKNESFISRDPTKSYFGEKTFLSDSGRLVSPDAEKRVFATKLQEELKRGKESMLYSDKGSLSFDVTKTPTTEQPKELTAKEAANELLMKQLFGFGYTPEPSGPTIESQNKYAEAYNKDLEELQKKQVELKNKYSDLFKTSISYAGETRPGESSVPTFTEVPKSIITEKTPRYKQYIKDSTKLQLETNEFYKKYNIPLPNGLDITSLSVVGGAQPAYTVGTISKGLTQQYPTMTPSSISFSNILGPKDIIGLNETGPLKIKEKSILGDISNQNFLDEIKLVKPNVTAGAQELLDRGIKERGFIGNIVGTAVQAGLGIEGGTDVSKAGKIISQYESEKNASDLIKSQSGETIVPNIKPYRTPLDLSSLYYDIKNKEPIYTVYGDTILTTKDISGKMLKPIDKSKLKLIKEQPEYLINPEQIVPREFLIPATPQEIEKQKGILIESLKKARKNAINQGNKKEAIATAKTIAIIGAFAYGVPALAGVGGIIGGAAKLVNSLPVRVILGGLWGLSVKNRLSDAVDKIKEGKIDEGYQELGLTTAELLGVGLFVGAQAAAPKIKTSFKTKLDNIINNNNDPKIIRMQKSLTLYKSTPNTNEGKSALAGYLRLRNTYLKEGNIFTRPIKVMQLRNIETQYGLRGAKPLVGSSIIKPTIQYTETTPGYIKGNTYQILNPREPIKSKGFQLNIIKEGRIGKEGLQTKLYGTEAKSLGPNVATDIGYEQKIITKSLGVPFKEGAISSKSRIVPVEKPVFGTKNLIKELVPGTKDVYRDTLIKGYGGKPTEIVSRQPGVVGEAVQKGQEVTRYLQPKFYDDKKLLVLNNAEKNIIIEKINNIMKSDLPDINKAIFQYHLESSLGKKYDINQRFGYKLKDGEIIPGFGKDYPIESWRDIKPEVKSITRQQVLPSSDINRQTVIAIKPEVIRTKGGETKKIFRIERKTLGKDFKMLNGEPVIKVVKNVNGKKIESWEQISNSENLVEGEWMLRGNTGTALNKQELAVAAKLLPGKRFIATRTDPTTGKEIIKYVTLDQNNLRIYNNKFQLWDKGRWKDTTTAGEPKVVGDWKLSLYDKEKLINIEPLKTQKTFIETFNNIPGKQPIGREILVRKANTRTGKVESMSRIWGKDIKYFPEEKVLRFKNENNNWELYNPRDRITNVKFFVQPKTVGGKSIITYTKYGPEAIPKQLIPEEILPNIKTYKSLYGKSYGEKPFAWIARNKKQDLFKGSESKVSKGNIKKQELTTKQISDLEQQKKIIGRSYPLTDIKSNVYIKGTTESTIIKPKTSGKSLSIQKPRTSGKSLSVQKSTTNLPIQRQPTGIKTRISTIPSTISKTRRSIGILPMLGLSSTNRILPSTKITPITTIEPSTEITPITNIKPMTSLTPITHLTPMTDLISMTRTTPITAIDTRYYTIIPQTSIPTSQPRDYFTQPEPIINVPPPNKGGPLGGWIGGPGGYGSARRGTGAREVYNKLKDAFATKKSGWSKKI